jgi:hypothetical protein
MGNILLFIKSRPDLGPNQPPLHWVAGAVTSGVNQQGREADHSLPSSAEVKNDGAIPPLPHKTSCHFTFNLHTCHVNRVKHDSLVDLPFDSK